MSTQMDLLVEQIRQDDHCVVRPPAGVPSVAAGDLLPPDLARFYELCGGVDLFLERAYGISVVSPEGFAPADPVIIGEQYPDDISAHWYIVGRTADREHLTIDAHADRLGRCYDSFDETHGVAGSCAVVARTFRDLLTNLFQGRGEHWYWLQTGWVPLGDAYD